MTPAQILVVTVFSWRDLHIRDRCSLLRRRKHTKLQTNIIRNKISNIEILQAPLGDEVKYKKDKIHHNWGEEPIQLEAKYETLDSIYDQLGRPKIDLIKIDVDGYDLEVIKVDYDYSGAETCDNNRDKSRIAHAWCLSDRSIKFLRKSRICEGQSSGS